MAGNTARKREDFRKFVRRSIPGPAELERRMLRLLEAYEGMADGNGHLVLHEEAVKCFHEQLRHARKGCVSDPEWGAFCPDGSHAFRGDGDAVVVPKWRMLRGTSQLEGFHPMQAATISGTNVGAELGNAQLLEAAVRWNRKVGGNSLAHADVQRDDVLRGIALLQKKLRGDTQLPEHVDPEALPTLEEFGVGYLLQGLGADARAAGKINWRSHDTLRKKHEPKRAGLAKTYQPYPVDKSPEMIQAFTVLFAESGDPEDMLRLYKERYFAPSGAQGDGASGYYLTNIVFVKKWLKE